MICRDQEHDAALCWRAPWRHWHRHCEERGGRGDAAIIGVGSGLATDGDLGRLCRSRRRGRAMQAIGDDDERAS
ncbi:MAG TPA: hypothetical protein VIL85_11030 [Thermomicrobiales bacterium]